MPRLLLLLVLLVALSAAAGEIPLSDVQYGPGSADSARLDPVVVGGDGFLVLWSEYLFDAYFTGYRARAYDADGHPLQPGETLLGADAHAVWTGEEYLVVQAVPGGRLGLPYPAPNILVQRLRRDGTPAGPETGHLVSVHGGRVLSLAWNGTHALALVLVGELRLLLLDREGNLVSDTPAGDVRAVAPRGDSFFLLHDPLPREIAEGNGRYAVVYPSSIRILNGDGVQVDDVPIATRKLAWDGSAWLTAYRDAEGRICTATFTGSTDVRRDCRVIADAADPAVGVIPRRTFLAWEGANKQIVTDSGIASMTAVRQSAADTAVDATGLLVAWIERGIQLDGLRHDGTRRERFFIPDTCVNHVQLAEGLIVWRADGDLFAMRLEANGAPLHPILPLGTGVYPRVVRNGDGWLVLRDDHSNLVATTISADAVITGEHVVAMDAGVPEIAAAGDGFLVATLSTLQRIDRNGVPVGAAIEFDGGYDRRIACFAQACLIAKQGQVILVDREGRTLRGPQPLRLDGTLVEVEAHADGNFRVYTTRDVYVLAPDGTLRGTTRWNDTPIEWGGIETLGRRTFFFYSRDGRVYLRDLPPRSRAVRH
jgi:hypothetical protein